MLTLIPVLDLLGGVVVRGRAGERGSYRPIVSPLVSDPQPLTVARAYRARYGLETLYLADLDAILHQRPNLTTYRALVADGFTLWVDAGVREAADAEAILEAGATVVIAGLETLAGPSALQDLAGRFGPERICFSLDMQRGELLGQASRWMQRSPPSPLVGEGRGEGGDRPELLPLTTDSPSSGSGEPPSPARGEGLTPAVSESICDVMDHVREAGVRQVIVLDLAAVGMGTGIPTLDLCRSLRAADPDLYLITGGGVRDQRDITAAESAGVDGLLVASVLHDGGLVQPKA